MLFNSIDRDMQIQTKIILSPTIQSWSFLYSISHSLIVFNFFCQEIERRMNSPSDTVEFSNRFDSEFDK